LFGIFSHIERDIRIFVMIFLWALLLEFGFAKMILYTINESGQIQFRDGDNVEKVNGKNFLDISSSELAVFATHKNGKLYHRRNFKEPWDKHFVHTLESPEIPIRFTSISILGDEYQWALTQAGDVYRSVRNTFGWDEAPQPQRSGSDDDSEGHFSKIIAIGETTYGVCKTGALFQLSKKDKWEKIEFEHSIVDASISSNGELYIVSDGVVFHDSDNGFENLGQEGGFRSVEVVEDIIWALNNKNELFQLINGVWQKTDDDILSISSGEMPTDREGYEFSEGEVEDMPPDFDLDDLGETFTDIDESDAAGHNEL